MDLTIDEEMAFADIQNIRKSQIPEPPPIKPEKRTLLRNLSRIEEIDKRTRFLQEQIHENPLDFFNILVWEVELEKLAFDKEKLLKKNERLHKALGNEQPPLQQVRFGTIKKPYNPNVGYAPIDISSLAPRYQDDYELKETEKKLEELHERKDKLFIEIQQTATGIADQSMKDELDEITRIKASLMTKMEELRLSKEAEVLTNKHQNLKQDVSVRVDKTDREKAIDEIKSVPEWNNQEEVAQVIQELNRDEQNTFDEIQGFRESAAQEMDNNRDME